MALSIALSFFLLGVLFGAIVVTIIGVWLYIDYDDDEKKRKKKALFNRFLRHRRGSRVRKKKSDNDDDDDDDTVTDHIDDAMDDDDIDGLDGGGSFLTAMMARLWPHIRIVANDMMMDTITEMLSKMKSPKMTLKTIDFGPNPIRMDNCVVHQCNNSYDSTAGNAGTGSISIDFDTVWDAILDVQVYHDLLGNFGLQHMLLLGRMNLVLQPCTGQESSVVLGMTCTFINTPTIKLSLKGVAKIAENNTLIRTMIDDIIKGSLNSMIVLPIRFPYKLSPNSVNYYDMHRPPIGFVRIRPIKGRGFVVQRQAIQGDDVPDVYMNISLGGNSEIYRTRTIPNSLSPVWNYTLNNNHVENSDEYHDFLLCDYGQQLFVDVYDEDNGIIDNIDDYLGTIPRISIRELALRCNTNTNNNGSGCIELQLRDKNNNFKSTGAYITLQCQVHKFQNIIHTNTNTTTTRSTNKASSAATSSSMTTTTADVNKKKDTNTSSTTTTTPSTITRKSITIRTPTATKTKCHTKYGLLTILVSHAVNVPLLNNNTTNTTTTNGSNNNNTPKTNSVYVVVEQQQEQEQQQQPTSNTTTTTSVYKTAVVTDSPGYDPSNPVFDKTFFVPLLSKTSISPEEERFMESYKISLMNNDQVIASTVIQPKRDFIDNTKIYYGGSSSIITRRIKFGSIDTHSKEPGTTATAAAAVVKKKTTRKDEKGSAVVSGGQGQKKKDDNDNDNNNNNDGTNNCDVGGGYFEFQAILYRVNEVPTTTIPMEDEDSKRLTSSSFTATDGAQPTITTNSVAAIAPSAAAVPIADGGEEEKEDGAVVASRSRSLGYSARKLVVTEATKAASTSALNTTAFTTMNKKVSTTPKKNTLVLRIRLIRGRGFQIQKLSFGRRDVPDVYCIIRVGGGIGGGDEWRTTTIRNKVSPIWPYEVHDFILGHRRGGSSSLVDGNRYRNQTVSIRVWDEDDGNDSDDFLGYIRMSIKRLLNLVDSNDHHKVELELLNDQYGNNTVNTNTNSGSSSGQRPTGAYITISCQLIWK